MSYKTDLQTNNTDLQSILATINALEPNTTTDVCTVTIDTGMSYQMNAAHYTILDASGAITTVSSGMNYTNPTVLENVICGSIIYIHLVYGLASYTITSGDIGMLYSNSGSYGVVFTAPSSPNSVGEITFVVDD